MCISGSGMNCPLNKDTRIEGSFLDALDPVPLTQDFLSAGDTSCFDNRDSEATFISLPLNKGHLRSLTAAICFTRSLKQQVNGCVFHLDEHQYVVAFKKYHTKCCEVSTHFTLVLCAMSCKLNISK